MKRSAKCDSSGDGWSALGEIRNNMMALKTERRELTTDGALELTDSQLGRVSGGTKCDVQPICGIIDIIISTPPPTPPTLVHEPLHTGNAS
jgi:hypothetical protein